MTAFGGGETGVPVVGVEPSIGALGSLHIQVIHQQQQSQQQYHMQPQQHSPMMVKMTYNRFTAHSVWSETEKFSKIHHFEFDKQL